MAVLAWSIFSLLIKVMQDIKGVFFSILTAIRVIIITDFFAKIYEYE